MGGYEMTERLISRNATFWERELQKAIKNLKGVTTKARPNEASRFWGVVATARHGDTNTRVSTRVGAAKRREEIYPGNPAPTPPATIPLLDSVFLTFSGGRVRG
jgi:hypothetical protein